MSSRSAKLYSYLLADLEGILDSYQLAALATDASLWPDATVTQAQAWYLGKSLLKKFCEGDKPSPVACRAALEKFEAVNARALAFEICPGDTRDEELIQGVANVLEKFWYRGDGLPLFDSFAEIFADGKVGKGANRGARGTDLYTKIWDSTLSYTSESLPYIWQKLCQGDLRWAEAENLRNQTYGTTRVGGNKFFFVKKNETIARCAATEPTINMWFQLGIASHLEARLTALFGVDLQNQQDVNGCLARIGSANGSFATIDLESASDSVSNALCKRVIPKHMLTWLNYFRSTHTELPDGTSVELGMISTMGNGFTFPLQTVIFCAVVSTVYTHLGIPFRGRGKAGDRTFGVFGDDIIVVTEAAPLVLRLLDLLGFRANRDKTFVDGPFRESCGRDWFNGQPCRGVYIKKLRSDQDIYVAINGLNRWSALTGIPLTGCVEYLLTCCRRRRFVPCDENDDAGIHVPLDTARGVKHLQHGLVKYFKSVPLPVGFAYKGPKGTQDEEKFVYDKGVAERSVNPSGLYLAFLYGAIRGGSVSLRQRRVRYETKDRISGSWDTLSPRNRALGLEWRRWSDAVRGNM